MPTKVNDKVQEEAERARTTPAWAVFIANAMLSFGTTGLVLLACLLLLDLALNALIPLWLGGVTALLLCALAVGLAMFNVSYTLALLRERGFRLQGFSSVRAAVNFGFDEQDVVPGTANSRPDTTPRKGQKEYRVGELIQGTLDKPAL